MCRFVGYIGDPAPAAPLVFGGTHPLVEQAWAPRELLAGHVNADGYGVSWYRDGTARRLARAEPIWYDPDLEDLLSEVGSSTIVASLRNATPGIPLGPLGVAPMVLDRWSFVLNGFVEGFRSRFMRRFHALLPDDLHAELRGTSDTEALFLLAVASIRDGAGPGEALAAVVGEVRSAVREEELEAQLNMVLTDGEALAVTRASSSARTNSLYLAHGPAQGPGGVVVASEPLDREPGWRPVEPQRLVVVSGDGRIRDEELPR